MAQTAAQDFELTCNGYEIAFIREGQLNVLDRDRANKKWYGYGRLLQETIVPKKNVPAVSRERTIRQFIVGDDVNWRIAYGQIWSYAGLAPLGHSFSRLFPLEDLPLLDARNEKEGDRELKKKYKIEPESSTPTWGEMYFDGEAVGRAKDFRGSHEPPLDKLKPGTFEIVKVIRKP